MSAASKFVRCLASADEAGPREVHRGLCYLRRFPECGTCPHQTFALRLRRGLGDEHVACPRWDNDGDRMRGFPPHSYGIVRRELCFTAQPFPWCSACPNRQADELPRTDPGWYEFERWLCSESEKEK
jgi:hypothetical protein